MTTQTITVNFSSSLPFTPGSTIFQNFLDILTLDPANISGAGNGITLDPTNTIIQLAAGGTWSGTLSVGSETAVIMSVPPHSGSVAWGDQLGAYDASASAFLSQSASGFLTLDNTNFVDQGGGLDRQTFINSTFLLSGNTAFNFRLAYQIAPAGITVSALAPTTSLISAEIENSISLSLTWSNAAPPIFSGSGAPVHTVLPLARKVRLDCERKINLGL